MNFEFKVKEDGTAVITKVKAPLPLILVPSAIEGHVVNEIGTDFIPEDIKFLVSDVILPQTIEKINSHSFNNLMSLNTLILNEGLKEIDDYGIFNCSDLVEIYIPESVNTFGDFAVGYKGEHENSIKQENFTLVCEKDSPAEKYAINNGINYKTKIIMA